MAIKPEQNSKRSVLMSKKRKIPPDWSNLHHDLLDTILQRLPFSDKFNFKNTCRSWRSGAKSHIKSMLITANNELSPLLLMPANPEDIEEQDFLYSIVDNVQKPLNLPRGSHCIGSSKGWLIILQNEVDLFMFHPILDFKLHLPSIFTFADSYCDPVYLPDHWIKKAVIFGNPILDDDCGVAVIYAGGAAFNSKLAFAKYGDKKWTQFENSDKDYCDIIPCKDYIFALSRNNFIQIWDTKCSKLLGFGTYLRGNIPELKKPAREIWVSQSYLIESNGDILLVIRCMGEFENGDGEVGHEDGVNVGEIGFKTKNFYVYRLDLKKRAWIEMDNLGDQMLFVGGNQSTSIFAKLYGNFKRNSIYFSDDYFSHDMGVFDMEKRCIDEIYEYEFDGRMTNSFWILPC